MAWREQATFGVVTCDEISVKTLKTGGDPINGTASTELTVTGTELNILDGATCTTAELNTLDGAVAGVTFTIGTEAANVINVGLQLEDADGNDVAAAMHVTAYLSDDSGGIGISATAPDTSVAVGTDGAIIKEVTSKLMWNLQSETDGDIDLDITETGADTWYMVVILPTGKQVVSGAITFA